MQREILKVAVLLLGALALDQLSKIWAVYALVWGKIYPIVPSVSLLLVGNKGVSFSLLDHLPPTVLSGFALVLILCFAIAFAFTQRTITMWAYGLIMAGALGNFIDRVRLGAVIDFILLHYQNFYWPVFNFADVYICVAAALLIFDSLRNQQKSRKNS